MEKIHQKNIAGKALISQGFFSLILSGHRRPSWQVAKRIAKVTGTSPELWLEGAPEDMQSVIKEIKKNKSWIVATN